MKGDYRFEIHTDISVFDFVIKRNITILKGNSGIGKTTLLEILENYLLNREESGFYVNTNVNYDVVLPTNRQHWKSLIGTHRNTIIFIEENNDFIYEKDFTKFVIESGNYFVFISRDPFRMFPYSYKEIYTLKCERNNKVYQKTLYTFESLYSNFNIIPNEINTVLTEDSRSGLKFFSILFKNLDVITSKGNTKILSCLESLNQNVLIIADGAAFGTYIEEILFYIDNTFDKRVVLYLPESFEWLLLKSKVINFKGLDQILENPSNYIESRSYLTWERFFTYLALNYSDERFKYTKHALNPFYLQQRNLDKVKSILPKELQKIIDNQDNQESQNNNDNQQLDKSVNTMNLF